MSTIGEAIDLPAEILEQAETRHEQDEALAARIEDLLLLAKALSVQPVAAVRSDVRRVTRFVREQLVRRMESEYECAAHLAIRDGRPIPSRATLEEVEHLTARLEALGAAAQGGKPDAVHSLRETLFDLHTLLRLHICGAC